MATYTVLGHPLNYADLGLPVSDATIVAIKNLGVGQTFTITSTDDTRAKAHKAIV